VRDMGIAPEADAFLEAMERLIDIKNEIQRLSDRRRETLHALSEGHDSALVAERAELEGQIAGLWDEYRFEVTSPGLGEPQWIYTLALPLLAAVVIGRAIGHLIRVMRARKVPKHEAVDPI